jgi:hypothetical protein
VRERPGEGRMSSNSPRGELDGPSDNSAEATQVHWLFKPTPQGVSCLGIQVFPDGDYWVYDSPTGTYAAGHADRGRWRAVYERYVADGYVAERDAKATGLVAPSWTRQPPNPPWARQRRIARLRAAAVLVMLLATAGILVWLCW